jgi:hypothetical protein
VAAGFDALPSCGSPVAATTTFPSLPPLGRDVHVIARGVLEVSQKQKNKSRPDVLDANHF